MHGTITDAVNRVGLQTHGHDKIVTLSSNVVLVERSCLVFERLGKMTPCKKSDIVFQPIVSQIWNSVLL